MIRVLSSEQMRESDNFTINTLNIPSSVLIERAGNAVFEEITKRFKGGRVLIVVGKGNNGNDGLEVARLLKTVHGFNVAVFKSYEPNFEIFNLKFDIIIDCLFGIGLSRNVDGENKKIIELINESGCFIISCDISSGLNANNGLVMGSAVKAHVTIAIQELKYGHLLNDGIDFSGDIIVKDVGIAVWEENFASLITADDVKPFFVKRKRNVNKGSFGKTAIIGGSKSFSGSSLLSINALTSLKMGVGYSYLFIPESLHTVYACKNPECIVKTFKDYQGFYVFDEKDVVELLNFDSIALGMGMGVSEEVYKLICYLLKNYKGNLLIDADGLNSLSKYGLKVLSDKTCEVVLTPHIGEFSRLIDVEKSLIINNPIEYCKSFSEKYKVITCLKSSTTVISDGEKVIINTSGNNSLAKAGSGDVLAGVLSGLLTRDESLIDCVSVGAYIFGLSADIAVKEQNEYTVTATDVVSALPKAINSIL